MILDSAKVQFKLKGKIKSFSKLEGLKLYHTKLSERYAARSLLIPFPQVLINVPAEK